ncbi:MAG: hypothetical protein QOJ65_48, partial [Fimbriimonadaceae bacterium]|nr:hypothetical protein [Fimbriimonadaceae bacterium]
MRHFLFATRPTISTTSTLFGSGRLF